MLAPTCIASRPDTKHGEHEVAHDRRPNAGQDRVKSEAHEDHAAPTPIDIPDLSRAPSTLCTNRRPASETKGGKPLPWPAAVKVADKVPCGEPKDCHHEEGKD